MKLSINWSEDKNTNELHTHKYHFFNIYDVGGMPLLNILHLYKLISRWKLYILGYVNTIPF